MPTRTFRITFSQMSASAGMLMVGLVERQARGFGALVVAGDAVLVEEGAIIGRGLREPGGGGRGDQDEQTGGHFGLGRVGPRRFGFDDINFGGGGLGGAGVRARGALGVVVRGVNSVYPQALAPGSVGFVSGILIFPGMGAGFVSTFSLFSGIVRGRVQNSHEPRKRRRSRANSKWVNNRVSRRSIS